MAFSNFVMAGVYVQNHANYSRLRLDRFGHLHQPPFGGAGGDPTDPLDIGHRSALPRTADRRIQPIAEPPKPGGLLVDYRAAKILIL